ncbi:MAG: SRPBCC domain-containing protein [Thermoleophilia bacterium]|nr:SRPBCC domain-containing protein [Thermoleophilia bacterium]
MREIRTETVIDASPEKVWQELTDLESWPEWNPFIPEASGEIRDCSRLTLRMTPPDGRPMTFKPRVTKTDTGRELRWIGHLGVRGIFDGEHYFRLEELPDGRTRLLHGEKFTGITVGLFGGMLQKTEHGFGQLNEALRERCEVAS